MAPFINVWNSSGSGRHFCIFLEFRFTKCFSAQSDCKKILFRKSRTPTKFYRKCIFFVFFRKIPKCLPTRPISNTYVCIKRSITVILIKKTLLICIQYLPCSYQKILLTKLNLSIQKYYISGAYSYWWKTLYLSILWKRLC